METIKYSEIKDPIVLIVDMVNGFCKEGALADEHILSIVPAITDVLKRLDCRNVFICDNHPPKTREFEAYPSHCVIGTKEAEIIDELKPFVKYIAKKNSTNAFMSHDFKELVLGSLSNYRNIVIVGCCTDLCILQLALSMQGYLNEHNLTDQRIIVPSQCVDTYDIEGVHDRGFWNEFSLNNMETNGILVVDHME